MYTYRRTASCTIPTAQRAVDRTPSTRGSTLLKQNYFYDSHGNAPTSGSPSSKVLATWPTDGLARSSAMLPPRFSSQSASPTPATPAATLDAAVSLALWPTVKDFVASRKTEDVRAQVLGASVRGVGVARHLLQPDCPAPDPLLNPQLVDGQVAGAADAAAPADADRR